VAVARFEDGDAAVDEDGEAANRLLLRQRQVAYVITELVFPLLTREPASRV
jgi:hypothetical protein